MKLHELRPAEGARKARKRIGRGLGSGHGKTAGRGTKGQGARTSFNIPRNFEGGQTKLAMRVPKLRGYIRDRRTKLKKVGSERVSEVVKAESRQPRPGEVCTGAFAIAVLVLAGCASMHNGQVPRALDKLRRRRTRW